MASRDFNMGVRFKDETGHYVIHSSSAGKTVEAEEYVKSANGDEIYPTHNYTHWPIVRNGAEMYAKNELGDETYPMSADYRLSWEYCLRDENGKLRYARLANGNEYYPRDTTNVFYLINDDGKPRFIAPYLHSQRLTHRHLDRRLDENYFMTVPFDRDGEKPMRVGRMFVELLATRLSESRRDACEPVKLEISVPVQAVVDAALDKLVTGEADVLDLVPPQCSEKADEREEE